MAEVLSEGADDGMTGSSGDFPCELWWSSAGLIAASGDIVVRLSGRIIEEPVQVFFQRRERISSELVFKLCAAPLRINF